VIPPITFEELQTKAFELGWDDIGVTQATIPEADIAAYEAWLQAGYHAELKWMENRMRTDPTTLLPGAKSAILFVTYYKQPKVDFQADGGVIASYARGRDYHHVHRKRLKKFIHWLEERSGQSSIAKGFSDSSPILEKALAVQAGLGWFGKNTLLIHRQFGTFILLSGLLTTLEFTYAKMELRLPRCGTCTRCIDACPTQALVNPYILDANLCLSYHLIESKKQIPEEIRKKNPGYIFGCDICQDACPHNWRKKDSTAEEFMVDKGIGEFLTLKDLDDLALTPEKLYGTPLKRRGIAGLKHTLGEETFDGC
jgi:epoxyqueuosine reductase